MDHARVSRIRDRLVIAYAILWVAWWGVGLLPGGIESTGQRIAMVISGVGALLSLMGLWMARREERNLR
jgi:hypothetical protein